MYNSVLPNRGTNIIDNHFFSRVSPSTTIMLLDIYDILMSWKYINIHNTPNKFTRLLTMMHRNIEYDVNDDFAIIIESKDVLGYQCLVEL